jgi:hypothetical protein
MRLAVSVFALLLLAGSRAVADEGNDLTVDVDPTTTVKTLTVQTTFTGATYGPGNYTVTQIITRLAAFRIGKSLVRLSLPRVQTINGQDSGFSDTQLFYLFQGRTRSGAAFAGVSAQFPTATSPLFGTGKWLIGPAAAYVFVYKPRRQLAGVLLQSAFTVAGASNRQNQSVITFLPFGLFAIGNGWYVKVAEAPWVFDLQRGSSIVPFGAGVGHLTRIGGQPVLIAISDEATIVHANAVNAPKNTIRLTFTTLLHSQR